MKTKKLLVSLLTFLAVICMSFSVVMLSNTNGVRADGYTPVADSTNSFVVSDGASVRTKVGTSGMRFIVQMNPTFYQELSGKTDVKWGAILAEGQADDATIDFTTVNGTTIKDVAWVGLADENTWGSQAKTITPYAVDTDKDGTTDLYQYTLVISFNTDGKSVAQIAELYGKDYNVRAYVTYTEESDAKVVYSATNANTNRSIVEVAEKVLLEDALNAGLYNKTEMASAKSILVDYINAPYALTAITSLGYIEDFSASTEDVVNGLGVADGEYTLVIEGQNYDVTVADGSATLTGVNAIGLNLGESYMVIIKGAASSYVQEFKFVSKAIETEEEFLTEYYNYYSTTEDVTKYYDGATASARYIVLANDINLLSNELMSDGETKIADKYNSLRNTTTRAYKDILDGQGYTLKADVFFEQYALFMNVDAGAVFKNIKFDLGMAYNDTNNTSRAIFKAFAGTLDNVYIDLNKTNKTAGKVNVFQTVNDGMTAKDVFINVDENIETAVNLFVNYSNYNGYVFNSEPKYTLSNYVVISNNELHKCFSHDSGRAIWAYNDGVPAGSANDSWDCYCGVAHTADNQFFAAKKFFRYDSAELAAAGGYDKVGDWTINADGTASWSAGRDLDVVKNYADNNTSAEAYSGVGCIDVLGYYEDFSASTADVLTLGVIDGIYNITINGQTLANVEVVDGVATIAQGSFTDLVLGETYLVTLTSSTLSFVQKIKVVSKVIDEDAELVDMINYYKDATDASLYYDGATLTQRYYILTADVSFGNNHDNTTKLYDILDGNGHKVTGELVWSGIWYAVKTGAVIKNTYFSLTGGWYETQAQTRYGITRTLEQGATIENCAIKMNAYTTYQKGSFSVLGYTMPKATIKDVYIDTGKLEMNSEVEATTYYGYLSASNWETVYLNNVHVVSKMGYATKYSSADENPKAWVAENEEIPTLEGYDVRQHTDLYHYTEVSARQVGNWTVDATGNITWTATVYEEITMGLGGVQELGEIPSEMEITIEGDAVELVDGYLVAKKVGLAVVTNTYQGVVYAQGIITVIDVLDVFTATVDHSTITVNGTASISIYDAGGKEYVGNVAYSVSEAGIVDIAADGTITGVAVGEVEVAIAFQVLGFTGTKIVTIEVTDLPG